MKEIKRYVCDICGVEYKEKLAAKECEKSHKCCKTIVRELYHPLSVDITGYPIAIDIEMKDGKRVRYKRLRLAE